MGAVSESITYAAGVSPARELDARTEPVRANTNKPGARKFTRIPTHAVGVARERRRNPRACLCLPLRLTRAGELAEPFPVALVTRNISSSGVYFLAPRELRPGTAIELEVALVERPLGFGRVEMYTAAHIVRSERYRHARLARICRQFRRFRPQARRRHPPALPNCLGVCSQGHARRRRP